MACNLSDSELDKVLLGYIHSRKLLSFVIVTVREKTFYTNWFSSRLSLLCRRRFCYWRFFDSIVPFQNNRCNEKKDTRNVGEEVFVLFMLIIDWRERKLSVIWEVYASITKHKMWLPSRVVVCHHFPNLVISSHYHLVNNIFVIFLSFCRLSILR